MELSKNRGGGALLGGAFSFLMPDLYVSVAEIRDAAQQPMPGHASPLSIVENAWDKAVTRDSLGALIERNHLYEHERATKSMGVGICLTQVAPICSMRGWRKNTPGI